MMRWPASVSEAMTLGLRWSMTHRRTSLGLAGCAGALLYAPFFVADWQALQVGLEAQDQLVIEKMDLQALEQQIGSLEFKIDALKKEQKLLTHQSLGKVLSDLQRLAHQEGLVVSNFNSLANDASNATHPSHVKQQVFNFEVKGSWTQWQKWSDQVQETVPNVYLSSLKMSTDQGQGSVIQMRYLLPYEEAEGTQAWHLAGAENDTALPVQEPLNASLWQKTQLNYLRRTTQALPKAVQHEPHPLEKIPLQDIEYVGRVANQTQTSAVLRVASAQAASGQQIYMLRVGDFLGKDMGQIVDIKAQELVLRELVLDTSGAWLARTVKLPLANKTAL